MIDNGHGYGLYSEFSREETNTLDKLFPSGRGYHGKKFYLSDDINFEKAMQRFYFHHNSDPSVTYTEYMSNKQMQGYGGIIYTPCTDHEAKHKVAQEYAAEKTTSRFELQKNPKGPIRSCELEYYEEMYDDWIANVYRVRTGNGIIYRMHSDIYIGSKQAIYSDLYDIQERVVSCTEMSKERIAICVNRNNLSSILWDAFCVHHKYLIEPVCAEQIFFENGFPATLEITRYYTLEPKVTHEFLLQDRLTKKRENVYLNHKYQQGRRQEHILEKTAEIKRLEYEILHSQKGKDPSKKERIHSLELQIKQLESEN
ncbi:MAG: hypothetical protein LBF68_07555, partial [Christensenellaceae bacterium]|nr:hypothetical protein [Christensenellaceae bacterium]